MASSLSEPQSQDCRADDSRKVQVTILASEWGSSKVGLSTINRELAIHLAKCPEVEITFFLPQCSQEDKKVAMKHNVKIIEATPMPGFEQQLDWLCLLPEDLQIDIIISHGVKLGKQVQIIKRLKKCKWVQVVHTDPEELGMFKNYSNPISKGEEKHKTEVKLCEMADHVVGVGPKLSEAFRSYLCSCQKDDNVVDFTPGVFEEFENVKQAPSERQQRSVLVFGRGDVEDFKLKGFDIAGKAVAELEDTRLVFVGAPDGKHGEIAKRLMECGVPEDRLRVRGFQDRESLRCLFQGVDLVVMPSRTEGFGLAGLEALSAGLPVLVSCNSGFGKALHSVPFGSTYVVSPEKPADWTSAIKTILGKDRRSRLEEAETLRESYGKKYNWAKQIKDLIDKMISWVYDDSSDYQSSSETKCRIFPSTDKASQQTQGVTVDPKAWNVFPSLQNLRCDAEQVSKKTNLPSDLRAIAANKGFFVSDNQASGNCLFHALSEQLQSVKGIRISHKELRKTLVQFLDENPNLHEGTSLFNFVSGYPSWREYLQSMAKDCTWGDHVVLFAAANHFQSPIRIISSLDHEIVVQPDHALADTNPLVLGHIHELHYVSLQPRQGSKTLTSSDHSTSRSVGSDGNLPQLTTIFPEDTTRSSDGSDGSAPQLTLSLPSCVNYTASNAKKPIRGPPELNKVLPSLADINTITKPLRDGDLPVDVLLLTVKNCEFLACYSELKNPYRCYFDGLGYVYFSYVDRRQEKVKVALLKCFENSSGPGGSLVSVKNAATVLRPKAVISVGACSGLHPENSKLADVVVSAKIATYASKVVINNQEQSTGMRSYVSKRFLDVIKNCADGWKAPLKNLADAQQVQVYTAAEFLSGPEQVISGQRRDQLAETNPQAIAMENEGEGVFTAAFDCGIEWLIVKGIADYADGSQLASESWLSCASVMAASLVAHMLNEPCVFHSWPHYQGPQPQELITHYDETSVAPFIERMKKHVRDVTDKPYRDLKSPFHNPGEGPRRDLKLDEIFTNLIVYEGRAKYDFSGDRVKQLNEYHKANESLRPTLPGDIIDAEEQKILVVGRPGIGKTMFSTKILRNWASDNLFNETQKSQVDFKVAFLIKLRMFNSRNQELNLREINRSFRTDLELHPPQPRASTVDF